MTRSIQRQSRVRATYFRGGTSKGVFFEPDDLPMAARVPGPARDRFLSRLMGSPDPYGKQTDGMGAATSSTSKIVLVSRSTRPDCDVDYLFGQVAIGQPLVDWSGNCGNLVTAVGPFAIWRGLIEAPQDGEATVRIWQANLGKRIVAHVPMAGGEVLELGDFELDGVTFPAAEVRIEFMDPGAEEGDVGGAMFPTGNLIDTLDVPGVGRVEATLINAGNPTIFVDAEALGLHGTELQAEVNDKHELLARCEAIRAHGAVAMGIAATLEEARTLRQHTPKLAYVAKPAAYVASSGKRVATEDTDLLVRIFSMGVLHHAMTGTGAVAIAAASAIRGTVVQRRVEGFPREQVRVGHPSGAITVGAEAQEIDGDWKVTRVTMSRTARRLMDGWVFVPAVEGDR
jgi:probable AcnD-accessory protein PrpF